MIGIPPGWIQYPDGNWGPPPMHPAGPPVGYGGREQPQAGPFRGPPPRPDCRGLLGRENTVQRNNGNKISVPAARDGDTGPILQLSDSWQGMPEPEPRTTTLNLFRRTLATPAQIPPKSDLRFYAVLSWGAGKSEESALVDFHNGTRITLDASSVAVSYLVRSQDPTHQTYPVELGASLVYGRVTGKQATYTDDHFTVDAGSASGYRPIPSYARSIVVVSSDPTLTTVNVSFSTDAKGTAFQVAVSVPIGYEEVPIPNGMLGYSIGNSSLATNADFQAIFPLFL